MKKTESTAIVYSFKGKWIDFLQKGEVSVFFRKRPPKKAADRVYLYVGSPVCATVGWAQINRIEIIDIEHAMKIVDQACIEKDELSRYLDGTNKVGAIFIEKPIIYKNPISISEVRRIFNFFPPQNFVRVPLDSCEMMETIQ